MTAIIEQTWMAICAYDRMIPGRGVTALVGDEQVAIFRDPAGELYAVGNYDPFTKAYVIGRGILGSSGDHLTVASPMLKHKFDLRTGQSLDDVSVALPTYQVRIVNGVVEVAARTDAASADAA